MSVDLNEHQTFERDWWSDCLLTFGEEAKQLSYAHRMGMPTGQHPYSGQWPYIDLEGRSVVDIGGGPVSLLLKCDNRGPSAVVDPCPYPEWVYHRYTEAGITVYRQPAEEFAPRVTYDEAWMYNVLLHVDDPELIVRNARSYADTIRIFEWLDTPPTLGHPQTLTAAALEEWLGGRGTIENINENGAHGLCFYGVFPT